MFGFKMFLGGTLVGTLAGLFVANFHVVHTPQGIVVVPRSQRPPLSSSYVDIRTWSQAMWANHPEVTQALVADGRSSLIRDNLPDNLPNEILPQQTQDAPPRRSRNVAGQSELPIRWETDQPAANSVVTQPTPAPRSKPRLLDTLSPARKQFESAFDEAIAPMVEDDPAVPADDVMATAPAEDAMVQQLEEQFSNRLNAKLPATPGVEALPTSGDTATMARDLLQQVIPQGSSLPRSATPFRDLGRDLLSAPAPGQGGASLSIPKPATHSQLNLNEPL